MAVRKRTGFKGVSSPKLTALKAQRNAANKRLATANAQIKAAKAKSKAAKARSKAAIVRSKVAKKKIQKIKSKHRSKSIQTQRGVVKARGGGPARPASKLQGQIGGAMEGFFNPFPQAAAFQAPLKLAWKTVLDKAGKTVINPRTKKPQREAYTVNQPTSGEVEVFEGGMPGILGMPVGTGQPLFMKSGDKIVKTNRKTYTAGVSGDIAESKRPDMNPKGYDPLVKPGGGEDFAAAGAWWSDYTKLTFTGKSQPGGGQPGPVSKRQASQPGWYIKPDKEGKGGKLTSPAGTYRVLAGKGKTRVWAGSSSRLEAGSQPGGGWAFKKWLDYLTPSEQEGVRKSFTGPADLLATTGGRRITDRAVKKTTVTDLNAAWKNLRVEAQATALKGSTEAQRKSYGQWGFRGMNPADKKALLKKAGIDVKE